ncbi:ribosome-associated protein [Natronospira proteinivora]|uniref:Ribosome-associated protein n=1 Tax=Natronospira proteinivora TaxID=1807133 RepID=A0ABT1G9F5_9GAMM|nr:ribosome biogenesis factor YjgA [Natronospira proteinivora]MCP1727677.1 ribosome-associated protein [Natronospira proteinivora]
MDDENGTGEDDRPSRSQMKREAEMRQKMGERLSELPDSTLRGLGLPDELVESLKRIRHMRRGGGLRRERQRIGALMRKIDISEVKQTLAQREAEKAAEARAFHHLEQLRDRMLAGEDEAFKTLQQAGGDQAVQQARELVHRAEQEEIRGQPPAAARALFRLVRDTLSKAG